MKVSVIIKDVLKFFTWSKILLIANMSVLFSLLFVCFTMQNTLIDLQIQMNLHKYVWKQEIRELNVAITEALDPIIKINNKQVVIDNQQQREIVNLTDFVVKLGKILTETDRKQFAQIRDIRVALDKLTTHQTKMLERLNRTKKIDLDNIEDIKRANFLIYNSTTGMQGSGSLIKIEKQYYILTAAHLIKENKDFVWAVDNNGTMYPLGLTKLNKKQDLLLFKIYMVENRPYLEISKEKPKEGSEIIVIGNPSNMVDIVTDGIIAKELKKGYIFTNIIYFGNSGGAVLYKGKIVGVVNSIRVRFKPTKPLLVNYGFCPKLEMIQEFLKGIE